MIYVKSPMNNTVTISIGIRPDNTFTRCPICGCEFPVDLSDFCTDEHFNLDSSEILCEECSGDIIHRIKEGGCGRT